MRRSTRDESSFNRSFISCSLHDQPSQPTNILSLTPALLITLRPATSQANQHQLPRPPPCPSHQGPPCFHLRSPVPSCITMKQANLILDDKMPDRPTISPINCSILTILIMTTNSSIRPTKLQLSKITISKDEPPLICQ